MVSAAIPEFQSYQQFIYSSRWCSGKFQVNLKIRWIEAKYTTTGRPSSTTEILDTDKEGSISSATWVCVSQYLDLFWFVRRIDIDYPTWLLPSFWGAKQLMRYYFFVVLSSSATYMVKCSLLNDALDECKWCGQDWRISIVTSPPDEKDVMTHYNHHPVTWANWLIFHGAPFYFPGKWSALCNSVRYFTTLPIFLHA